MGFGNGPCLSFLNSVQFSSITQLCPTLFSTPCTTACQASLFITNSQSLFRLSPIELVMPSNHLILCHPLLLLPSVFPSIWVFSNESASGGESIGASASSSVLPMNIQDWFPLGLTGLSPRDSEESSPTPQFKSINSSVLRFFYGPTLTSIHNYWKNHCFDCVDLCQKSTVSAF